MYVTSLKAIHLIYPDTQPTTMAELLLNFTSLRPPELLNKKHYVFRYIRDVRPKNIALFRELLLSKSDYLQKILVARQFFEQWKFPVPDKQQSFEIPNPFFFSQQHYYYFNFDNLVRVLRQHLTAPRVDNQNQPIEGVDLGELTTALRKEVWWIKADLSPEAPNAALHLLMHSLWSTLYATSVMASVQTMETNYLLDTIRSLHILLILKYLKDEGTTTWPFKFEFNDFEVLVDENIF